MEAPATTESAGSQTERSGAINLTPAQQSYINSAGWGPTIGFFYYMRFWSPKRFVLTAIPWLLLLFASMLDTAISRFLTEPDAIGVIPIPFFTILIAPALLVWTIIWSAESGRKIAWKSEEWTSFEQYQESQSAWDMLGVICLGIIAAIMLLLFFTDLI